MLMIESVSQPESFEIVEEFESRTSIVLTTGDCLDALRQVSNNEICLVITSPPYNIGKVYEQATDLESYLRHMQPIIKELVRVLAPGGSICWQTGNYVDEGVVFPLDIFFYPLFASEGLKLRNRIVWHFEHGLHATKRFSGRYETLLWFTKGEPYTFNLDPVRVPSKYPGKTHFKGQKRGQPSGNPLGKNPSDFWQFLAGEWETGIWEIPNVKANHPEKTNHPCQFPIELAERCVLALTNEHDWVLDPFAGAGSALLAALRHHRRAMGCEKEEAYIEVIKKRVADFYTGQLAYRPLGKPVYQPSGREKVAQMPSEWKRNSGGMPAL
jgi:adenine-specific DNA-methyltransferase